jgi:hypothetical protein
MFFLVCTFKRLSTSKSKIDVQKQALRFRKNLTIHVLVSLNSQFHPLLSYLMTTLSIGRVCNGDLGIYKL